MSNLLKSLGESGLGQLIENQWVAAAAVALVALAARAPRPPRPSRLARAARPRPPGGGPRASLPAPGTEDMRRFRAGSEG
jgi:hypothetical protein